VDLEPRVRTALLVAADRYSDQVSKTCAALARFSGCRHAGIPTCAAVRGSRCARVDLAQGSWLRRQRRVKESRRPLVSVQTGFDALGAAGRSGAPCYATEQAHTALSESERQNAVLRSLDHYVHTAGNAPGWS
jgi:hypothetical protein